MFQWWHFGKFQHCWISAEWLLLFLSSWQQLQVAYQQFMKEGWSVFIYFLSPVLCSLSLEVTVQPSFSPPTRGSLRLTIADQRRKHNAHIHAASAPFYVKSTNGGSVCLLTTRICFFRAFAWIIWPERVTQRKARPSHSLCPKSKHWCLSLVAPSTFLHVRAGGRPLHRQL